MTQQPYDENGSEDQQVIEADSAGEDYFEADIESTLTMPRVPADIRSMEAAEAQSAGPGADDDAKRTRLRPPDWRLLLILAAQIALAVRLLSSNGAGLHEAAFLTTGHAELAHWLHGAPRPDYGSQFFGIPAVSPALAAAADHFGGLTGARLLSVAYMLLATMFLWGTARRLHGEVAAFAAGAAFVALGSTQSLGGAVTSDAMGLALLAAAAYLAVRTAQSERRWPLWLIPCAVALVLADVVSPSTALWNPFIGLLLFAAAIGYGLRWAALLRPFCLAVLCAALIGGGNLLRGKPGWAGLTDLRQSIAFGRPGDALVDDLKSWIGWVLLLAAVGVLAAVLRSEWSNALVGLVCLAAAVAAPAAQFRIETLPSLVRQTGFGAWFACIALGYLIHVLAHEMITAKEARVVGIIMTCAVLLLYAGAAMTQSRQFMQSWPDTRGVAATIGPYVHRGPDRYLVEGNSALPYDLRKSSSPGQWHDTRGLRFYDPKLRKYVTGERAYAAAVRDQHFSVIVLNGQITQAVDAKIVETITLCKNSCGYRMAASLPYHGGHYTVWLHQGATR
ncbi:glycosyltransferase family 39 protein [Streptomyces sp. NPDC051940]|uniref:glycosyltransferase family 39 protein n=1 Tax=Streptomyces sp. NPDC051940 TaxID=3155675 RepID=UPI00343855A7